MAKRQGKSPKIRTYRDELPEADKQMLELMETRIKSFNVYRRSRIVQTKANVAYLCGHQNIQVVNQNIEPLTKEYATEVVCNLILPAVINDIAVAGKVPASYDIVPAGTDEDDKATAMACQKILPYLKRINAKDLHRASVMLWYDLDGIGWRKVFWDAFDHVKSINPGPDEQGHNPEIPEGEAIYEGEVRVEPVPNTEVIFDHRARSVDNLDWVIHGKTITLGLVRQRYGPEFADEIDKDDYVTGTSQRSEFETAVMGEFATLSHSTVSPFPNTPEDLLAEDEEVEIYEYWHRPSKSLPTGAYAVLVGGRIAANEPFPTEQYPHRQLPLIPAAPVELKGIQPGSISRISQARPLQREYNKMRSMILDNLDALGNSVVMAPRDSNIEFKRVVNTAGNMILYDGPFKPSRESGVPMPNQIFAYMAEIKSGIEEIFAFHEPSKGKMPVGGPKSARGLEVLQGADYTQLGPIISGLEESDEKVVYQMLTLAITNYQDRMFNIVGDDYRWTLQEMKADELKGKINVIVQRGSSTPLNKEQESQRAFHVWESGLLGDPNDPSIRLHTIKQMQLGNVENILQENAKHVAFAKQEFLAAKDLMESMPPVPPDASEDEIQEHFNRYIYLPPANTFDDHYTHIKEHGDFIMAYFWEFMGQGLQQQIMMQTMIAHSEQHKAIITQAQMQQMLAQTQADAFSKGNTMEQLQLKQPLYHGKHEKKHS